MSVAARLAAICYLSICSWGLLFLVFRVVDATGFSFLIYYSRQISLTIVSPSVDSFVALVGAFFLGALPFVGTRLFGRATKLGDAIAVVSVTILSGTGLIVGGLTHWVARGFDPHTSFNMSGGSLVLNLAFSAQRLAPAILLLVILVCVARIILSMSPHVAGLSVSSKTLHMRLGSIDYALLSAILISSIIIASYPYWRSPGWIVGTDAYWLYRDPLQRVLSTGPSQVPARLFEERHPFYIALLYILNRAIPLGPDVTVVMAQICSAILWVLASWMVLAPTGTKRRTALTAGLAAVSSQIQIGLFSSILAQWLALILMVLFFALILGPGLNRRSKFFTPTCMTLISTAILMLHPWTWGFFVLVVVGYVFLTFRVRDVCPTRSLLLSLAFPLVLLMSIWIIKPELIGQDFPRTIGFYARALASLSAGALVRGLSLFFNQFSAFLSWVMLSLAVVGVMGIDVRRPQDRLLSAWTIVGAASMLLLSGVGKSMVTPSVLEPQTWRGFFLLPLPFLAGTGLCRVSSLNSDLSSGSPSLAHKLVMLATMVGVAAAFTPGAWILPLLLFLSIVSWTLIICKAQQLILLGPVLVAFLFALVLSQNMIALSQLLLDPHNYHP